ncbi:protein adenylyltransferase SelO [Rubrimonas cliftonensis]|uniref:Protein nucleotidyltransferase YdiU n=1 Tax=Rubrimonas cliftonensis TaxID=89524 RepID=A0A1H4DN78_9RHOB|nr:YdiU family protein [Rubrimonas cliftonensis]SEA74057.1 Uncharacterized conserved protein YdiU, UPF0061 family [Rubrimonas cliftonensis]
MTDAATDAATGAAGAFRFDNSYARLPERFFARVEAAKPPAPSLLRLNEALAVELGLDPVWLAGPDGVAALSGLASPPGAEPIAMAYAGHQFGGFSPQLGDGRALLLGEIVAPDGLRRDIQLKGSGQTPFSRRGDGRAALGPVLRELIVAEAMHALGVPTTRSLAAVLTGDLVHRETPLPGAVLTRVARSHVRFGTFEYFAAREDDDALRTLTDYVVARHYPDLAGAEFPAAALLEAVVGRTASLVAQWQGVGFIHGVMNTDNMSIVGETIDYGPCAFMDVYHPATVFSSIDAQGRYAYGNQPRIALWNLARLAQALLPLMGEGDAAVARAQAALDGYPARFEAGWLGVFRAKLGLATAGDGDAALIQDFLTLLAETEADFTNAFRALADAAEGGGEPLAAQVPAQARLDPWLAAWRERLAREVVEPAARAASMRRANPWVIPRNHRVEAALASAGEGDLAPLDALRAVLAAPCEAQPEAEAYRAPPRPEEEVRATFCGT